MINTDSTHATYTYVPSSKLVSKCRGNAVMKFITQLCLKFGA